MAGYKKILWVEDFDSGRQTMDKYDFDQTYVHVVRDFADALLYIKEEYGTFDTVLLDINLELGEVESEEVQKIMGEYLHPNRQFQDIGKRELKDNAGFYVYLYLLHKGFPRDRVCFLTGYKYAEEETRFSVLRRFLEEHGFHKENVWIEYGELLDEINEFMDEPDFADIADGFMASVEQGNTVEAYQYVVDTEKRLVKFSESSFKNEDIYGKWDENFSKTGIKSPDGYNKEVKGEFNDFKGWLKERQTPYYLLRYGVVSACEYLCEKMDENPSFLRFERAFYLPKKNRDLDEQEDQRGERLFSKEYFQGLLLALKEMLPLHEPDGPVKKNIYKQIIRFIAHDWEGAVSVNKYSQVDSDKEQGYKDRTYFSIMKLLRNWSAHNKLIEFTESDVAFFLLVALRSYFRLNNLTESFPVVPYEEILLQVVEPLSAEEKEQKQVRLQQSLQNNEIKLNQQFDQLRQRMIRHYEKQEKVYLSMSVNLYDVLKDIGKDLDDCTVHDLHIMLWYGMCSISFGSFQANIINVKYDYTFINRLIFQKRKENDLFTQLYIRTFEQLLQPEGCQV
ncbi:hypothetical protein [Neobacillus sp. Marseille-QA0830]